MTAPADPAPPETEAPARPAAHAAAAPSEPAPERGKADLGNWRTAPHSLWAFHHVRELVPSAVAEAEGAVWALPPADPADPGGAGLLSRLSAAGLPLGAVLEESRTTALVILQQGRIAAERYRLGYDGRKPHLLFSISKSISGLLAGILAGEGRLDRADPVTRWLPETAGSAYDGATLGHVLDMTVRSGFEESYLDKAGDYVRYREATGWNPVAGGRGPSDLRGFLSAMRKAEGPHGAVFHYASPHSDLLGWLLERASGRPFAELLSERLWSPMGAEAAAEITVDRFGAPRSAGGISVRPRDLARLGETVRRGGLAGPDGTRRVVPADWIAAMRAHDGDGQARAAWVDGDMAELFPAGSYRAKWYRTGLPSQAIAAIGIHGQWLWIDPAAAVVIVKLSAQDMPVDDALDQRTIRLFDGIGRLLADDPAVPAA